MLEIEEKGKQLAEMAEKTKLIVVSGDGKLFSNIMFPTYLFCSYINYSLAQIIHLSQNHYTQNFHLSVHNVSRY